MAAGWPWPTGHEFPAGLTGPFQLKDIVVEDLPQPDGATIHGWILRPALPAGVGAPVLLEMGPYFDGEDSKTGSTKMVSVQEPSHPLDWVREGYAVAFFSVRGTGLSTGCFNDGGLLEQKDVASTVEWLAAQPWSNGRVGMMGLSYPGTTPMEAIAQGAKGLAAVAVIGTMVDRQWFWETPEHEPIVAGGFFGAEYVGRVSARPAASADPGAPGREAARICPQTAVSLQGGSTVWYTDAQGTPYWHERRYRDHFADSHVAVFLQQGFNDARNSGHMYQDKDVWALMPGPKRMFEGQWAHETPPLDDIQRAYPDLNYTTLSMTWFDYWLKGQGTPATAGVGVAEYEDNAGVWHRSTAWPPTEAAVVPLFLSGEDRLALQPGTGTASFQASPNLDDDSMTCQLPGGGRGSLAFVTAPAKGDVLVSGNPTMDLDLASSGPSGSVTATLFRVSGYGSGPCRDGTWQDISWGGANIRFYGGRDNGTDFPVGAPTSLHVTLSDLSEVIPDGARLGVWITGDGMFNRPPTAYPLYTIHEGDGSVLTLPVVQGGFAAQ